MNRHCLLRNESPLLQQILLALLLFSQSGKGRGEVLSAINDVF
jgi:hypothetical protein